MYTTNPLNVIFPFISWLAKLHLIEAGLMTNKLSKCWHVKKCLSLPLYWMIIWTGTRFLNYSFFEEVIGKVWVFTATLEKSEGSHYFGESSSFSFVGDLQPSHRHPLLKSSHIYLTFTRSAVVLHTLCFGSAEISLVVLKMELIFLFLILLPPREGETAVLYWAIIYLTGNFLIWTFSNLHRSRKQSMVNFFQSPITCFCIYQHFVKPGSSISTQFFPQSILKEISNIMLLYLKIFQYTSSRPF